MNNYKTFNRHEIYTLEMMDTQSKIMRKIEDIVIEQDISMWNTLSNMMAGLYDGYLYDDILTEAESFGLDQDTINDIKDLVKIIETHIEPCVEA